MDTQLWYAKRNLQFIKEMVWCKIKKRGDEINNRVGNKKIVRTFWKSDSQ